MKYIIIIWIIFICLYHYFIQNGIEKIFNQTYFNYDSVKRPLKKCENDIYKTVECIGMPSGQSEIITILSCLLYYYNFINLPICISLIIIVSIQRIITDMHTLPQVTVGFILGFIYSYLYITLNGWYSSIIILFIGLILIFLIIHKIDKYVYGPIPDWVDKDMLSSIYKKQDSPWYSKISHILANSYLHERTFMSWNDIRYYYI